MLPSHAATPGPSATASPFWTSSFAVAQSCVADGAQRLDGVRHELKEDREARGVLDRLVGVGRRRVTARRIARPRERHERRPLGASRELLFDELGALHRLRGIAVERHRAGELDLRDDEPRVELGGRREAIDRVHVSGARERRSREELVPRLLRRLVVPLRQERGRPHRVPLEEERRDPGEGDVGILHPDLLRARHRVLEGDVGAALQEPEERALAEPLERRPR